MYVVYHQWLKKWDSGKPKGRRAAPGIGSLLGRELSLIDALALSTGRVSGAKELRAREKLTPSATDHLGSREATRSFKAKKAVDTINRPLGGFIHSWTLAFQMDP